MNPFDLSVDLGELPTTVDGYLYRPRERRETTVIYNAGKRQVARHDAAERAERLRLGLASYTFAVLDPTTKRWQAGVMLNTAPRLFYRKLSLPVFETDTAAMAAAATWQHELEKHR